MGKNPSSSKKKIKKPHSRPAHANGEKNSLSNLKDSSKASDSQSKTKSKGKSVEKSPSPACVYSEEDGDSEDRDDSEGDGVDEEGMDRLMQALGEDGLDEIGRAQLEALAAENGAEEGSDDLNDSEGELGSSDEEEVMEAGQLSDESSGEDEEEREAQTESHKVAMDGASSVDEDAIPYQKVEVDNKVALDQIRESIKLDASLPWTEILVLSYPHTIDVDVHDDLNREVAFYKQALHSAQEARRRASKHNLPFTRPADYFAEMVKSDAHMERIRMRLLNESSSIKKTEDKKKEREGKKFGKQVQIEKIKERERNKKEMGEKLKSLKRKRKDILDNSRENDDEFDVAVEDVISDRPSKRGKASNGKSIPRSVRDKKYGFGGTGRRAKQNTKDSTDNFDPSKAGWGKKPGKGGFKSRHNTKRLGKSRRVTAKSKS